MRFDAVLFDCDGVLVDSEPITNGVLRDMLAELGWSLSSAECMGHFVGRAVKDQTDLIYRHTGFQVDEPWLAGFRERRNVALLRDLQAIEGIHDAVDAVHAEFGGRVACASGADRFKVELQLEKVGLLGYFDAHIYSGHETPRSKPWPDVYLAAASGLGVAPVRCLVVEDTVTGVTAGVAAGAHVLAYAPLGEDVALLQAGAAKTFKRMSDLPGLLAQALKS
jgi:HAD superfamily hydrolase (TIGR01509 family)